MKVRCNLGHRRVPFLSPAALFLILLAALFLASPGFCGPIHDAARDGNLARVKALLKSNPALLKSRDDAGETPLHWAAFWGRVEVADFLIAKGAELHARDHAGRIPLDYAIAHGRDEMVVLLRRHDPAAQMASIAGVAVIPAGGSAPASRAVQPAASERVPAPAPVPAKAPDAAPGAAPPASAPTVPEAAPVRPAPAPEAAPAPVPAVPAPAVPAAAPAPAPANAAPVPAAAPVAPAKESSASEPAPLEAVPAKAPEATPALAPPAPAAPAAAAIVLAPAKAAPTVPVPPAPAATVRPALPLVVPAPVIVPAKAPEAVPASASPAPVAPAAAPAPTPAEAVQPAPEPAATPLAPPAVREAPPVVLSFSLPVEVGSTTAWTRVRIDFPKPAPQTLLIRLGAPLYEAQMAGMLGQRGGIEPVLWTDGAELVIGSSISAPPDSLPSGENSGTLNSLLESGNGTVKTSLNGVGWPAFVAQVEGAVAGPGGKPAALLTAGALLSENMLGNLSFDSDPGFPLTFRLVRGQGLVYLCGRGTVTVQGIQHAYGQHAASADWGARLLKGKTVLEREGAAQSIGWLREKKFLQPLIEAMANPKEDLLVRRSAIEAAGRIHDAGAVSALETLSFDRDPRLSAIARWSLKQIDLAR